MRSDKTTTTKTSHLSSSTESASLPATSPETAAVASATKRSRHRNADSKYAVFGTIPATKLALHPTTAAVDAAAAAYGA